MYVNECLEFGAQGSFKLQNNSKGLGSGLQLVEIHVVD